MFWRKLFYSDPRSIIYLVFSFSKEQSKWYRSVTQITAKYGFDETPIKIKKEWSLKVKSTVLSYWRLKYIAEMSLITRLKDTLSFPDNLGGLDSYFKYKNSKLIFKLRSGNNALDDHQRKNNTHLRPKVLQPGSKTE